MSVKIEKGDLFDPAWDFDAIGHGVNCLGLMGAGIAKPFAEKFPEMYREYQFYCKYEILRPGSCFIYGNMEGQFVLNIASQRVPGKDAKVIWLVQGLYEGLEGMTERGLATLGLPWIGCGIGGLEQDVVLPAIEETAEVFPHIDITIVEL